jgi:hypothetical protein
LTYDHFDRVAALGLVGAVGLRAVAVGEVAGALHGCPLIPSEEGTLDLVVHPEDREVAEESVLAAAASRGRVRLLDAPAGTYGFADLARAAITVTIQGAAVEVAGLVDLRIALTNSESHSKLFALALECDTAAHRARREPQTDQTDQTDQTEATRTARSR